MNHLSIYLGKFIIAFYTSILNPLLPSLVHKMQLSLTLAASLVSIFSLMNSFAQPVMGWFEDKLGHTLFLRYSPLWVGIIIGLIGLAPDYKMLILILSLASLGICAFHPASYIQIAQTGSRERSGKISFLLAFTTAGFVLGPIVISSYVSLLGLNNLYLIFIPGLLVTLYLIKDTSANKRAAKLKKEKGQNKDKLNIIKLLPVIGLAFCISSVSMGFFTLLPLFLQEKGSQIISIGLYLTCFSCGCALGPFSGGPLKKRIGLSSIVPLSFFLSLFLILTFLSVANSVFSLLHIFCLGFFIMSPYAILIQMAQERAPEHVGTASALVGGFVWGSGGILVAGMGKVAEFIGIGNVLSALAIFPLLGLTAFLLGLIFNKKGAGP